MKMVISLIFLLNVTNILVLSQQTDTITLYYKVNESTITKKDYPKLDSLIKFLKDFKAIKVVIYGFADKSGTDQYNLNLSDARAKKVKAYIINNGISPNAISICKGMGKVQSVASADTPLFEYPLHRKVEIILMKKNITIKSLSYNEIGTKHPVFIDSLNLLKTINNLSIGESISLKNINFRPGSNSLLEESKPVLKELLITLRESPKLKIEIQGHICCASYFNESGIKLSIERAKAVYDYLVNNGIDSARLKYIGYGSTKPLIINESTEEDKKKNRRVEIKIIDK